MTLCPTCHSWAHQHPTAAREGGYIVSQWVEEPWRVPVDSFGWWLLACDGGSSPLSDQDVTITMGQPYVPTEGDEESVLFLP